MAALAAHMAEADDSSSNTDLPMDPGQDKGLDDGEAGDTEGVEDIVQEPLVSSGMAATLALLQQKGRCLRHIDIDRYTLSVHPRPQGGYVPCCASCSVDDRAGASASVEGSLA